MSQQEFSRRNFLRRASLATTALGVSSPAFAREPSDKATGGSVWPEPSKQEGNNLNLIL
jgi:hypothetical protein